MLKCCFSSDILCSLIYKLNDHLYCMNLIPFAEYREFKKIHLQNNVGS